MTAKYTIEGNELNGFNIRVKKYLLLPSKLVKDPKNSKSVWKSATRKGAQGYINILKRQNNKQVQKIVQ